MPVPTLVVLEYLDVCFMDGGLVCWCKITVADRWVRPCDVNTSHDNDSDTTIAAASAACIRSLFLYGFFSPKVALDASIWKRYRAFFLAVSWPSCKMLCSVSAGGGNCREVVDVAEEAAESATTPSTRQAYTSGMNDKMKLPLGLGVVLLDT